MLLCGWGGSMGQLLWVPCRPIWSGSLQASVCRSSGSQDMLHWASFLFTARPRKISIEGWIQLTASDRLPLSRRNAPSFLIKWKTLFPPPNTVLILRLWLIMKLMQEAGLWKCHSHLTGFPSHKLLPFEADQECREISVHTSLIHFCLLNWVDFNKQFKVTHQLLVGLVLKIRLADAHFLLLLNSWQIWNMSSLGVVPL